MMYMMGLMGSSSLSTGIDGLLVGYNTVPRLVEFDALSLQESTVSVTPAPNSQVRSIAWHPSGSFVAVGVSLSPFFHLYSVQGSGLVSLITPDIGFSGSVLGLAWNPTGDRLLVATNATPGVVIYSFDGSSLTKLPNPDVVPSQCNGVAWHPTGNFYFAAASASPRILAFSFDGNNSTKLPNPATLPTSSGINVGVSRTGEYVAITHGFSPFVTIYTFDGVSTLAKIPNPAALPGGAGRHCRFSNLTDTLVVTHSNAPTASVYLISGTVATKTPNKDVLSGTLEGGAVEWEQSTDAAYIVSNTGTSGFVEKFAVASDGLTLLAQSVPGRTLDLPGSILSKRPLV
jgi:WD40 repeat protein